jgi:predicted nucleic acid-binding protein
MQKSLKDFQSEEAIFIDASIFLHHAFDINNVSIEFLGRVETSNIKAYTSSLVIEEIFFKLIMQSASNYLEKVTVEGVKALLKNTALKEKVMRSVEEYRDYMNKLKALGLKVLDLSCDDMMTAIVKVKTYGLITADAAHLSVMERKGIPNMASGDHDFKDIDAITLWFPD